MDRDKVISQSDFNQLFSSLLREGGYKQGDTIYDFMKKMGIGESEVGRILDSMGKHEALHRLHGHHIIYDFPISNIEDGPDFIEHLFSDLFTKQGLPILPKDVLRNLGIEGYFKNLCSNKNWNMVNGFDLIAGYLSISSSLCRLREANSGECLDKNNDIVISLVLNSLEIATSIYTANIFLLVGSTIKTVSTIWKISNNSLDKIIADHVNKLSIEVFLEEVSLEKEIQSYSIESFLESSDIDREIESYSIDCMLRDK